MPEPSQQPPEKRSYSNQGRIPTEREMELQNRVYDLVDAIDAALDVLEPTLAARFGEDTSGDVARGVRILSAVLEGTPAYQNRADELAAAISTALEDLNHANKLTMRLMRGRPLSERIRLAIAKLQAGLGIPLTTRDRLPSDLDTSPAAE